MEVATQDKRVREVLDFWFGELDAYGRATPEVSARWSMKDPDFDREIRERFEGLWEQIVAGEKEAWLETAEGLVAYVVVLDQLSRNMFRGTAAMYASDAQCLRVALDAIERGVDREVVFAHRNFLYMPLMHSEDVAVQERCVALYEAWRDELADDFAGGEAKAEAARRVGYAVRHRDVVVRFGRYPHRNAIVGRPSTEEEVEFLKQPGSSF